jgi:hypothetical protein
MTKAASLGPALTNSVIGVGAPWYTSGSHMWNGAAPSLKAMPQTMNTIPVNSIGRSVMPAMAALICDRDSEPVTP